MQASDVEPTLHGLFLRGIEGDAVAYRDFLDRMARHLRSLVSRRMYQWSDDTEDLVQECLLAIHNQRHTFQSDQPITAWVGAIARYKLIDWLRAKSGREMLHVAIDDIELFAESQVEAGDAQRDVLKLLDTLPKCYLLPIVHVKLRGLSVAEAARHIGMSESAVKVNIHRGLKLLASKIKETSRENR